MVIILSELDVVNGAAHFVIAKSSEGVVTRTSVHALDEAGRREEIARMLSGAEVTAEARVQAERLREVEG